MARFGAVELWRGAVERLLPPVCLACGARVQAHPTVCAPCWADIAFICPPVTAREGLPLIGPLALEALAIAPPESYARARAAALFSGTMRELIHNFKYGDRIELAPLLANWMAMAGQELLAECDCLVPVPLHWRRLWGRRFNQSALLAQAIARRAGRPWHPQALVRTRATAQQFGLTKSERERNVRAAFAVPDHRRGSIAGKRVLLIDDVITTGATIHAASHALLVAGARAVDVLAAARALPGRAAEPWSVLEVPADDDPGPAMLRIRSGAAI